MTNLPLDRLRSLRPFTHLGSATLAMLTVGLMIATAPLPDAMAAEGDKPTGLEVAKDSDKAQRADSEYNVMTMTLENSRGQQRIRTIEGYSHELSEDEEHRFAKFLKPSDVKDTTLLTYDYREEDGHGISNRMIQTYEAVLGEYAPPLHMSQAEQATRLLWPPRGTYPAWLAWIALLS